MQNAEDHRPTPAPRGSRADDGASNLQTSNRRHGVILDLIPESTRAAGLGALMKGAGKLTRFIPIPQPTLLVGPGSSARLGQAVAGFGHAKILIVTDADHRQARPAQAADRCAQRRRRAVRGVR